MRERRLVYSHRLFYELVGYVETTSVVVTCVRWCALMKTELLAKKIRDVYTSNRCAVLNGFRVQVSKVPVLAVSTFCHFLPLVVLALV